MPDPSVPDTETDAIFASRILPELGVTEGGVDRPRWIFIGGQQGSGKTTSRKRLAEELGPRRTQMISGDDFSALVPEQSILAKSSDAAPAKWRKQRMDWTERLIERAWTMRAHVIWEQPVPDYAIEFGAIARELGYQVECQVLALPLIESWIASAKRNLSLDAPGGTKPPIAWSSLTEAYHRWPAFLALVEARVAFDRITVLDRSGQVHFENEAESAAGGLRWKTPAFAFESLLVERNQPRSAAEISALVTALDSLRTDPRLAPGGSFAEHQASLQAVAVALQTLEDDPASGFDLNQPDPATASAWIARLKGDLQACLISPEGRSHKPLAARGDRLLSLIGQMTGQPIR